MMIRKECAPTTRVEELTMSINNVGQLCRHRTHYTKVRSFVRPCASMFAWQCAALPNG